MFAQELLFNYCCFFFPGNKNAGPEPRYYDGSFRMSSTISNRDANSAEFKALSVQIERLVSIDSFFIPKKQLLLFVFLI